MVSFRYYLLTILALMLFGVPAVSSRFSPEVDYVARLFGEATNQLAAVILSHNSKSVAEIKSHYESPVVTIAAADPSAQNKVRILIVPGHEPDYGGAEYGSLKERNMTVELAQNLAYFLGTDSHYQTYITRDTQDWSPVFTSYFKDNWNSIVSWEKASFQDTAHRISIGSSTKAMRTVVHNRVPNDVATRLYGITKWANDNDIDITIHIHFNDSPDHPGTALGTHTGFTIYIPEHQYANGTSSRAVAETIFKRLSKYNPVSDLKGESAGLVEDQDLIAIGANDTASAASVLVEYGYI
jgi:N-acetylmuramoyl-L-alanine amidase